MSQIQTIPTRSFLSFLVLSSWFFGYPQKNKPFHSLPPDESQTYQAPWPAAMQYDHGLFSAEDQLLSRDRLGAKHRSRIPTPPPNGMVPHPPPPIPHTFCARHCNETYISIFLHARRCSETRIFILLDEPSRRIRWVDRAKLWRNANFKLQELLRAVYRTFQCSANGIIYIYTYTGTYPYTYIYIKIDNYIINKYIYIYIYIDKYIRIQYVYIHIHIHIIHIFIYTYIFIYILPTLPPPPPTPQGGVLYRPITISLLPQLLPPPPPPPPLPTPQGGGCESWAGSYIYIYTYLNFLKYIRIIFIYVFIFIYRYIYTYSYTHIYAYFQHRHHHHHPHHRGGGALYTPITISLLPQLLPPPPPPPPPPLPTPQGGGDGGGRGGGCESWVIYRHYYLCYYMLVIFKQS